MDCAVKRNMNMLRKWAIRILLLLAIVVTTTIFFGLIKTKQFSAYGECRKFALATKGYDVWKYKHTLQLIFMSLVVFNDGYNDLTCYAFGVGPFWSVQGASETIVGCLTGIPGKNNGQVREVGEDGLCLRDYFGVEP
jgi:hypothetical protein